MTEHCDDMRDLLVDYADGDLPPLESERVRSHLSKCKRCRLQLSALDRSLELARRTWTEQAQPRRRMPRPRLAWGKLAAMAGCLAIAVTLGFIALLPPQQTPADRSPTPAMTFEQVHLQVQREEAASRLLFSASKLMEVPEGRQQALEIMASIRRDYGDTAAGQTARNKPNLGETQ